MLSRFFIERPIFANVIAIMTMLAGAVTIYGLPIERYPDITPPTVLVSTVYPGADAKVLADTVATLVEQEVNGVENMLYMSSTCSSDGSYKLTVTFEVGTDLDRAQVLVQNRLAIAQPRLPADVQRQGITAKKQSTNIILAASLISPDNRFDDLFLSNYASLYIKDELSRIYGVGEVQVIGAGNYGMRIWLDPEKLKARNVTTEVVLASIREQNVQVAAGQVGQYPSPGAQGFQYNVTTLGRLSRPEEFEEIIIKADERGLAKADEHGGGTARLTRLKDVARVELGSQSYEQWCEIGGKPAATLAVFQLPGANALDVAKRVEQTMEKLKVKFPEGLEYIIPFNTTIFVEESIHEVYKTLLEAGVLVLVVILIFLQDWRAVLIPATTVPVTIVGAFAAMGMLGFSINMLTLFGLVLAIGIVVDDAIVIVENAAHHIDHGGMPAKQATIKAMSEVIGPIIGITLVLMAVFLPTAFLGGITGQLYRQFALTIAATAIISAINAVTLKPAQCATYLRPTKSKKNIFYRVFNNVYGRAEAIYTRIIRRLVQHVAVMMLVFAALVVLSAWWFVRLPTGFLPTEDQGFAILGVQLPDAASQARTRAVVDKVSAILKGTPGVQSWFLIGGQSIMDQAVASNASAMYITFTPWSQRDGKKGLSQDEIIGNLTGQFQQIREAMVFVFPPPALMGLGTAGGFEMRLEDRGNVGLKELEQVVAEMIEAGNGQKDARSQPILVGLQSTFRAQVPTLYADVDRVKAKSLGVSLDVVFGTLQTALGSAYVNDFNKFGKSYQVRVQADQRFRLEPEDIRKLEVRNAQGQMVPLGTLARVEKRLGPQIIPRYNMYSAAAINGRAAEGYSSGQALNLMEEMANQKLTSAMGFDWTGMSFQERRVGSQAVYVFGLAVLMVYLVLAAQYESWLLPAAVILVVPLALLGTVIAVALRGMDNNIYTQIGIVLIIALASKNAILIVEFARELRSKGRSILDAAVEASRVRFRPILMTSFAFILGIWPLVNATGAGAAGRRSLGTAVFGGMLAATVLAVFFVPVFYVLMQRLGEFSFKAAVAWIKKGNAITARQLESAIVHSQANGHSLHASLDETLESVHDAH
jgi:hydrophobic/amphiphilic exporter-1 (mainly G- bacteria), HAE1 family